MTMSDSESTYTSKPFRTVEELHQMKLDGFLRIIEDLMRRLGDTSRRPEVEANKDNLGELIMIYVQLWRLVAEKQARERALTPVES